MMLAALPVAIALLAQAASAAPAQSPAEVNASPAYGPTLPAPPKAETPVKVAEAEVQAAERCVSTPPTAVADEIVVCVQRPEGYRLNPDLVEARRAMRSGRPKRPERMVDNSCASVGPMGCTGGAGINLLGAAITLGTMAAKAVQGENVGKMFITDPQPTEYQLYLEAKRNREAKEADAAIEAQAKAKAAAQQAANAAAAKAPKTEVDRPAD